LYSILDDLEVGRGGKFQIYLGHNLHPYADIFWPITLENITTRGEMALKKSGALLSSLQNASGGDQVSKLTTVLVDATCSKF
jgi:hypothetical protein